MGIPGAPTQARLGRYELLARLATGGMGEIFLARLEGAAGFEKLYVVKRILPHLADDARFRQMLIAEARIAAKMSHPNICQVYELGETNGQLYIVMEYLEGVTMLPLLRRSSKDQTHLDFGFVAGVIQQTCDALNYAHELKEHGESLGIIHRDVTPSNIFLTESGVAKVLDFGIAKAKGASTSTQEGTVKGKYAYMAPEQLRGAAIDRRVDVFALGVVLYELLALRRLFQRKTDYLTFRAVMEQPIPDIRRYRPDVPTGLADALARALQRDPAERFDTARQFGSAILDALSTRPWQQGELGDFVRANFADEISKRSQQVATAVNRSPAGARATMPLIAHAESASEDSNDDDGFPSVETDAETPWTPPPAASGDFIGGTPPPFTNAGSTGSAPSLQPLRGSAPGPAPIAAPHRSLVWPLLALAMVAVAAGALFLVWRMMQRDQPPSQIIVTEQRDDVPPKPTPVAPAAPPVDIGSAAQPPSGAGSAKKPVVRPHASPYDVVVDAKKPGMQQCARDHADTSTTGDATAVILIAASGHPKSVSLEPESLNTTPLGTCIRNILVTAEFPAAAGEVRIRVPIKTTFKPAG